MSDELSFIQYADDTSIFLKGHSLSSMSEAMNNGINLVNEWLINNKLSLNVSKTNYMIMSTKGKKFDENMCKLIIDGVSLKRVHETNFLGIILDDKLTWKSHIDHICKKVSRTIGLLTKARKSIGTNSLVVLYNAIIKPYFTYCNIIWGNTYKSYLEKLVKLQKKILRLITFSEYNSPTGPLFEKIKVMTLDEMYLYSCGIHIFKIVNQLSPQLLWNKFTFSKSIRNPLNLQHNYFSKQICQSSIQYSGPGIWNNLPYDVKCAKSVSSFKSRLKKFILCKPNPSIL